MSQFKRGISQKFVDRLNAEYQAGGWWRAIADDRELFVAIRKDYINVYLNGNSLLKLRMEEDNLVGKIHYKYLLVPESPQPYVTVLGGRAQFTDDISNLYTYDISNLFTYDISNLSNLKRASYAYAGEEKKGVHQVVMSNPNVVDVEIAFGVENEKTGSLTANRIDFAALRQGQSGAEIVFYEAKQFANKELRAAGESPPPVLEQLCRYETFLCKEQAALTDSYRTVCRNLMSLDGVKERYASLLSVMSNISSISICEGVRLVIFGFDIDQKIGTNWKLHREKLEGGFDPEKGCHKDRLLLKGDANKFTKGISSKF